MRKSRLKKFKIGDKVSVNDKEGVIVFIEPSSEPLYNIHFYPEGRGLFLGSQIKKSNPIMRFEDIVDEDFIGMEEANA